MKSAEISCKVMKNTVIFLDIRSFQVSKVKSLVFMAISFSLHCLYFRDQDLGKDLPTRSQLTLNLHPSDQRGNARSNGQNRPELT